jgi:hypothetical protein
MMKRAGTLSSAALVVAAAGTAITLVFAGSAPGNTSAQSSLQGLSGINRESGAYGQQQVTDGQAIFRFDTFGDEVFWGDTLCRAIRRAGYAAASVVPDRTRIKKQASLKTPAMHEINAPREARKSRAADPRYSIGIFISRTVSRYTTVCDFT